MRRLAHQFLLISLLTLYGLVTVGGVALHDLPAFDHGRAHHATEDSKAPVQPDRHNKAAHDCPVCHFHAQGQLSVDPDDVMFIDVVRVRPPAAPPLFFPSALDRPSSPRAPPLA